MKRSRLFIAVCVAAVGALALGNSRPLAAQDKKAFSADVEKTANSMKEAALAVHFFHDSYNQFPAVAGREGREKGKLSWRVHVLPYMEEVSLFKQFKLDEPWDSAHNKKLVAKIPRVYKPVNAKLAAAGKTKLLAPVTKDTIFPPDGKRVRLQDIPDGTAMTILLVEADDDHAVVWTKPDDLEVDLKKPLEGLQVRPEGAFLIALADGSVRFIRKSVEPKTVAAMFTRAGAEVVMLRPGDEIPLSKSRQ